MGEEKVLSEEDRLTIVQVKGSKHAANVLHLLDINGTKPVRFNAIKRAVGPLASRTLSATLKLLERLGLITREERMERGLLVEYALTDKGRALIRALGSVYSWQGKWG